MAYDVTLVSPTTVPQITASQMGFPTSAFHTALYSQWLCGPTGTSGPVGIGPDFSAFLILNSYLGNCSASSTAGTVWLGATSFAPPAAGVRHHYLLSVNTATQTIQLYIDDQPVPVTGVTWYGRPFLLADPSVSLWPFTLENTAGNSVLPGLGDVWCATLAGDTFVDLSVTANRRKFINRDLSPVYLGPSGAAPFGSQPQIYLTVPSSGVATDFLTNRGTGGGVFTLASGGTIAFQAPGTCTLPPPPPPAPSGSSLAMDNVIAIDQTPRDVAGSQIFLMWSDDRGHSYGSPVGQPIGRPGAYLTSPQWQRLGYGRDRVFKLEWSVPVATALQGAFIDVDAQAKS